MERKVNILNVADYFISHSCIEDEILVTPLKLQKLCYYAQAWSLVLDNDQLFDETFEAWAHGPANHKLFDKYRDKGYSPILETDSKFNVAIFTDNQIETLDAVWDAYGMYDGKYLEQLTHEEKLWIIARDGCAPGDYCNHKISLENMKSYYTKVYADG